MSTVVCLECHEIFDDEDASIWYESHGLDTPPYECWSGCPCCKGTYVKAYYCDGCGEVINTDTYVEIGDKKYCEDCFEIHDLREI